MSLAFMVITALGLVSQEDSQTVRIKITTVVDESSKTLQMLPRLVFQDDSSKQLPSLIEKLRSDRIEERDQAALELRKVGKAAIPDLEKLAGEKDVDLATRARTIVRLIRLKEMLGVDLKALDDLPATTIVEWMEKKTGKKFLYTADMGLRNVRVRVHEELLNLDDPYAVGVDLLRLVHVGVTPSDSAPGAVELFPAPLGGKKALKIYKSADELPKANEFCTLVLQFRRVSPRDVQAVFINMMSFPQNCLSSEASGTLILSDYSSVLRRCAQLAAGLDLSRSFRFDVTLLEGKAGKEPSVPEAFRELKLAEATGLQQFSVLGSASTRLERVLQTPTGAKTPAEKTSLLFPGATPLVVEFDASVRAAGGPMLERFVLKGEGDRPASLLETRFEAKEGRWTFVGAVPTGKDGASIVVLARAVLD